MQAALRLADMSRRMAKWSIELGNYRIINNPRTSIIGQAVDFKVEFIEEPDIKMSLAYEGTLELFMDVLPNKNGSRIGVVLIDPFGNVANRSIKVGFTTINKKS